tara:strand:+ start:77 stop:1135 length:1059 start_codon:yes stop_codon:yes gene_type:complete
MSEPRVEALTRNEVLVGYESIKSTRPNLRARDVALELGISEAELLNSRTGDEVTKLEGEWAELIRSLPSLGRVMVLTRNENCVHEKYGEFDNISIGPGHGLVLNKDIDLRLFMSHWHFGFAVSELVASGKRHSLQFFDIDGQAVHKVYIPKDNNLKVYNSLVERFRTKEQTKEISTHSLPAGRADLPDAELDTENFLTHWGNLKDTHHFFGLLNEFGVGRRQSMRIAEGKFTRQVPRDCLQNTLNHAIEDQVSIMCFVGNPGCIQIHTGKIFKVAIMGPWLNILDQDFNLHLNQESVESIWTVEKPTSDGIVTSIEVFDKDGFCFCQFFGERKPGKKELPDWRRIVASIPSL